uniref:Odorant receptor n=1 Tax=Tetranychus urticae TaxID=32264 RepID=T1KKQ2_TETUR
MKTNVECNAKSVEKMLNYFFKYLKYLKYWRQIFSYLTTIPDSNEFDQKVSDLVRRTERLAIAFQAVRRGLNQTNIPTVNEFGYRRLNLLDWIIAITSVATIFRYTVLIFNTNETIAIYLGDSFFHSEDRALILSLFAISTSLAFAFREWILHLEAKGKFEVLSIWKDNRDGFNLVNLRMNNRNIKRFRFCIYFLSVMIYYMMLLIPIFMSFLFFTPLLINPWTYKIPALAFFATGWLLLAIFVGAFLFNSILGFAWLFLSVLAFHLFRLFDLLDSAETLLNRSMFYTEKDFQLFCLLIISRLNSFELASRKLRYIFSCYVFVYSLLGDVAIFLGLIVRAYNDFFADLLAILGLFTLGFLGIFGFVFGYLITELDRLTIRLHRLTFKGKFSVKTMSKVMEIMDRVAGPYNGLKIGDFFTLEKRFFILFIMENLSILMLFTVNIGPMSVT